MTSKSQKIKCLFGFHSYKIPHKKSLFILLCQHCMRFGYRKWSDGYEQWHEYNEKGNVIHSKDSTGYEVRYEYDENDENDNMIHYKNSDGDEMRWEYNDKGNIIHRKDFDGHEARYKYNEKGDMILRKDSNDF